MSNLLPANEHVIDRAARVVLGLGLLAPIGLYGLGAGSIVSAVIGGVLLFTAAVGSCPIYTALGLSTKPK
ncbi:MAG: DUF2892 domain-containing protein [Myxococcota bacterium]